MIKEILVQNIWVLQNSASNYRFIGNDSFELPSDEWKYQNRNGTVTDVKKISIKGCKQKLYLTVSLTYIFRGKSSRS